MKETYRQQMGALAEQVDPKSQREDECAGWAGRMRGGTDASALMVV